MQPRHLDRFVLRLRAPLGRFARCAALLALVLLPGLAWAAPTSSPLLVAQAGSPELKTRTAAIVENMKGQTESWNRGDLDGFMAAYLPSPEMTFTSGGVLVKGYDVLKARYQKFYGSNTQTMGTLRFDNIEFTELGKDSTLSVGRFTLQRTGLPPVDGIFSLVWVRTKAGWKILHDHSSARTAKEEGATTPPATTTTPPPTSTTPPAPQRVTMPGGLVAEDMVVGNGATATAGRTVSVHYTGWLANGTKFDSSVDRGQPFEFALGAGQVIPGWDRGVQGMKVGGKRRLTIPPAMGYGDRGAGAVIPPGATLYFEVELLQVR